MGTDGHPDGLNTHPIRGWSLQGDQDALHLPLGGGGGLHHQQRKRLSRVQSVGLGFQPLPCPLGLRPPSKASSSPQYCLAAAHEEQLSGTWPGSEVPAAPVLCSWRKWQQRTDHRTSNLTYSRYQVRVQGAVPDSASSSPPRASADQTRHCEVITPTSLHCKQQFVC